MSYILDALKKADAEREQGQVPGLHTPAANAELADGPQLRTLPLWVMGLGACLVLIAVGAVWQWTRPMTTGAVMSPPDTASSAAPFAQRQDPTPPMPVIATAPTPPHPADQEPTPTPLSTTRPEAPATTNLGGDRTTHPEPAIKLPVAQPTPRAPIHVDPAPTPAERVPTLAELPEDVRRSLPPLSVSGAMYSDSPANRMLLINNRVFHEGDQPVAGLVLEEIRLKSAVFRYRGTRYAVSY